MADVSVVNWYFCLLILFEIFANISCVYIEYNLARNISLDTVKEVKCFIHNASQPPLGAEWYYKNNHENLRKHLYVSTADWIIDITMPILNNNGKGSLVLRCTGSSKEVQPAVYILQQKKKEVIKYLISTETCDVLAGELWLGLCSVEKEIMTVEANVTVSSNISGTWWRCVNYRNPIFGSPYREVFIQVPVKMAGLLQRNDAEFEGDVALYQCEVNSDAFPEANVSWQIDKTTQTTESHNFTFTLDRRFHGKQLRCLAQNIPDVPPLKSNSIIIDVMYSPRGEIAVDGYTNGETLYADDSDLRISCILSDCNPPPFLTLSCTNGIQNEGYNRWKEFDIFVSLKVTKDLNSVECQCTAIQNKTNYFSTDRIKFNVVYPPIVFVTSNEANEDQRNVTIRCVADGNPSRFTIRWQHSFGRTTIRSHEELAKYISSDETSLTLPYLTFEDHGNYICAVNNGIQATNNTLFVEGNGVLDVHVSPKFQSRLRPYFNEADKSMYMNVSFYSNSKVSLDKIRIVPLGSKSTVTAYLTLSLHSELIPLIMYGKKIMMEGQRLEIVLTNFTKQWVGEYVLMAENENGLKSSLPFLIPDWSVPPSHSNNSNHKVPSCWPALAISSFTAVTILTVGLIAVLIVKRNKKKEGLQCALRNVSREPLQNRTSLRRDEHQVYESIEDEGYLTPKSRAKQSEVVMLLAENPLFSTTIDGGEDSDNSSSRGSKLSKSPSGRSTYEGMQDSPSKEENPYKHVENSEQDSSSV